MVVKWLISCVISHSGRRMVDDYRVKSDPLESACKSLLSRSGCATALIEVAGEYQDGWQPEWGCLIERCEMGAGFQNRSRYSQPLLQ